VIEESAAIRALDDLGPLHLARTAYTSELANRIGGVPPSNHISLGRLTAIEIDW